MIRDRLYELKPINNESIEIDSEIEEQDELHKVLNKFLAIRQQITLIRNNIDSMKALVNEQKFHYKDKNIREQMEYLITDSLGKSQDVHKSIKVFQDELAEPCESLIIFRVKSMQLSLIKNEYLNVYREHSMFVEKYEEKLKKILKREAQIMSRNISIEETEELISNKEKGPSLFVGNILEETQKAQHELREIVQRHNMLINLEKTMEEIRDMFFHISTYVMEQGSLIQVIEYETENATNYVDKGADQLDKARELQIKALKKKTYILFILLIVLGVIVLILVIT
ncbi:syntaxin-4-like [Chironomus tepperi]|uniref:syntaxin-4-like n=1 Tax=Chironomus tepperi TaxID=113505 RepID=UPI00391F5480